MSLAGALEAAAAALPEAADAIRPANGDPFRVLGALDAARASAVLAHLLREFPEDGAELADAWAEQEAGLAILQGLDEGSLPKAGRKELRRVLHRLRSKGVPLARPAPAPTVATLGEVEAELRGAWLSPLDPSGTRVAYFAEPHPGGGARLFEVVIDDARGVVGFEVYNATRGRVRRFLESLARRDRADAEDVPVESVRAAVAFAEAHQAKDRPLPRGYSEWRSRVAGAPQGALLPGQLAAAAVPAPEGPAALERAAELVRSGALGPWPPPRSVLLGVFERLRSALDSPLVVSGATRAERLDGVLGEAAREAFAGEAGAVAAHRFRESAFVAWRRGDAEAAGACLAAAAAFAAGELDANPVPRALLAAALGPALGGLAAEEGAGA